MIIILPGVISCFILKGCVVPWFQTCCLLFGGSGFWMGFLPYFRQEFLSAGDESADGVLW